MAWVALWFALIAFAVVLVAFLFAAFYFKSDAPAGWLGLIDTLLAGALARVYWHLFPGSGAPKPPDKPPDA